MACALALGGTLGLSAAHAEVDVHIGIPAPQIVFPAPPTLVVVPTAPQVRYVPDSSYDLFAYGDRYYVYDSGAWFVGSAYNGPFAPIAVTHVPRPIRVVDARYYKRAPRWDRDDDRPPGHRKHKHKHKDRGRGHDHHDHD